MGVTTPDGEPRSVFVASAADLLTDYAPHGEGLIAWQTFCALAARGHDLVVCASRVDLRSAAPFEVVETGRASRLESLEPLAARRRAARLFERLGGAQRFDAVHWLFPQSVVPFVPPEPVRLVIGPHSLSWPEVHGRAQPRRAGDAVRRAVQPLESVLRRRALARAAMFVSVPAALDDVPPRFRSRAHVVPFGVDETAFVPSPLPATSIVLFLGSLEQRKGVRELVDAFACVCDELRGARLLLGGEGSERGWIERRIRELGVGDAVELLGRVSHEETPELLRHSSLLCLPSHGEPFGMAILEAMATARAVVAVAEGGPAFLVGQSGGRLVPRGDVEALARALADLLGDPPALAAAGAFNRSRVEAEFALELLVDRLEGAYGAPAIRRDGFLEALAT